MSGYSIASEDHRVVGTLLGPLLHALIPSSAWLVCAAWPTVVLLAIACLPYRIAQRPESGYQVPPTSSPRVDPIQAAIGTSVIRIYPID